MKSTSLGGCIRLFLKNFFSNFRFHTKYFKRGRKCILINCKSCNKSPQQIPFQFENGNLPHSCCRAFWAKCSYLSNEKIYFQSEIEFSFTCSLMKNIAQPLWYVQRKLQYEIDLKLRTYDLHWSWELKTILHTFPLIRDQFCQPYFKFAYFC